MATKTADAGHDYVQPRSNYTGLTTMVSNHTAGGLSLSTGDVFWMLKVPNGALITDLKFWGRASGVGGVVFSVGTTGSASLFGAATISATHQYLTLNGASATQQMPYKVSLSDDAAQQYVTLALTVASGTATATGSFGLLCSYLMPGAAGP
jgi:hypothetical protein